MNNPPIHWEEYNTLAHKILEANKTDHLLNPPVGSSFTLLDEMLDGGFKDGELIILSAPTKQGKSTLAQTITWNMAKNNQSALWFTMEMSWQELTKKFMLMDDYLKESGLPDRPPIFYPIDNFYQGGELQLKWMRDIISESQRLNNIDFVVIDHLHFLLPLKDYYTNTSFLIGGIVREVKRMAVELQIPIMLIAHTTKLDLEKPPTINDIRDSSFITQESDFALIMWRIKDKNTIKKTSDDPDEERQILYTNKAWLSLEANRRNGRTGKIKLFHNGSKFIQFDQMSEGDKTKDFTDFVKDKIPADKIPF